LWRKRKNSYRRRQVRVLARPVRAKPDSNLLTSLLAAVSACSRVGGIAPRDQLVGVPHRAGDREKRRCNGLGKRKSQELTAELLAFVINRDNHGFKWNIEFNVVVS